MPGPYSKRHYERIAAELVREAILQVTEDGRVFWLKKRVRGTDKWVPRDAPKEIGYTSKQGRRQFGLYLPSENRYVTCSVPRVVWQLAHGDIPPDRNVNHKDGDPLNNRLDNLELTTQSENQKHRYDVLGHESSMSVLTRRLDLTMAVVARARELVDPPSALREALRKVDSEW